MWFEANKYEYMSNKFILTDEQKKSQYAKYFQVIKIWEHPTFQYEEIEVI